MVWTLLDTGLRVSELASLTKAHLAWQRHCLMIYGQGGPRLDWRKVGFAQGRRLAERFSRERNRGAPDRQGG